MMPVISTRLYEHLQVTSRTCHEADVDKFQMGVEEVHNLRAPRLTVPTQFAWQHLAEASMQDLV